MIEIIAIGIIALVVFGIIRRNYLKNWHRDLEVNLEFGQTELVEGETGTLVETVVNRKRMAIPMIKISFQTGRELLFDKKTGSRTTDQFYHNDVFQLNGSEKVTRTFHFIPSLRGCYRINRLEMVVFDPFFTVKELEERKVEEFLYVYPKPFHTPKFSFYLRQLNGDILSKVRTLEDPFEFRGIREYQPYDDMRMVNWKATAKTGDLKVTQKNYTSSKEIRVILNVEDAGVRRKTDQVEDCVRVAAGLVQHFQKEGMRTSLYSNGLDEGTGEVLRVDANVGTGHLRQMCRALARLKVKDDVVPAVECFEERIFAETGNVTCFISSNFYEEFTELLERYLNAGNEFVWFYVHKRGEELEIPKSLEPYIRVLTR